MDRPVHQLAEWDHIELAYGPPTNADLTVAAALGRDSLARSDSLSNPRFLTRKFLPQAPLRGAWIGLCAQS